MDVDGQKWFIEFRKEHLFSYHILNLYLIYLFSFCFKNALLYSRCFDVRGENKKAGQKGHYLICSVNHLHQKTREKNAHKIRCCILEEKILMAFSNNDYDRFCIGYYFWVVNNVWREKNQMTP